jgi:hypothetical protein
MADRGFVPRLLEFGLPLSRAVYLTLLLYAFRLWSGTIVQALTDQQAYSLLNEVAFLPSEETTIETQLPLQSKLPR